MFKKKCELCPLEVEGYTENQVAHMLKVHADSRHKPKPAEPGK